MKNALLDALDRALLFVLLVSGYAFALAAIVASAYLALRSSGVVAADGFLPGWSTNAPWQQWMLIGLLLAAAAIGVALCRTHAPPLAQLDPTGRPALRVVTLGAGRALAGLALLKAFTHVLGGFGADASWAWNHASDGPLGLYLGALAVLALLGVRHLEERWPKPQPKAGRAMASRILVP